MKKFIAYWSLLAVMAFGFCGCSDDDEGSSSDLIGTWECVSSYYYEKENGKIVYEGGNEDIGYIVQFGSDGICKDKDSDSGWEQAGTWSYKNGVLSIRSEYEDEVEVQKIHLKSLTSTEFVIEQYEKETYDGNNYEYYEKLIFRKISEQ